MNKFALTKFQKALEIITMILVAITFVYTVFKWNALPNVMAIHYNEFGEANEWGGRWTVFILPIALIIVCLIIRFCTRMNLNSLNLPFKVNMEREKFVLRATRDTLCLLNFEIAFTFTIIQFFTLSEYNLPVFLLWCMIGVIVATTIFGVWRSYQCNQGSL